MAASNLTLVLPSFSFSAPENDQFISLLDENVKSLVHLRRILTRGENQSFDTQEVLLTELFNIPYKNNDELPLAAIMAMGSGFDAATGYWFHAEPVHLYPDLDHVLLFDRSSFELTKKELAQLIEELQELFEGSGLTPHFGQQNNLFIRRDDEPAVSFSPLKVVSGNNILPYLPSGKDSPQWRLLQNEIQMQMTQSTVNQRREEQGAMVVNGLWFWGEGYLRRGKYARCYEMVSTKQLFIAGLARMTDAVIEKQDSDFDGVNTDTKTLVSFDVANNEIESSLELLLEFEQQWLAPALLALKKGKLESITLVTGKTKTTLTKKMQQRFWKFPVATKKLAGLLS